MERRKIGAIVLAAGLSRRMGQPKMLLPWGQTTVLGQVVSILLAAVTDARTDFEAKKRMRATHETETPARSADSEAEKRIRATDETEKQAQRVYFEADKWMPITDEAKKRRNEFEVIVVTGGTRDLVEAEVARLGAQGLPVRAIFNPAHETGEMMSSIRVGLTAIGPETEFALIALGDQPQLSAESARQVVTAAEQPGARLILPSCNMRRGHPWLVRRDLWPALMVAETGRAFLQEHEAEIQYIETDETVLKDLDTPEDYQQGLNAA